MNALVERLAQLSPAKRALLIRLLQEKTGADSIAVVGMACRLPGAANLDAYWRLLQEGRSAVTEVPASRWDVQQFYSPTEQDGKMTTRWGAFVDDVDQFDPAFFGIAPREASRMDPQQRLLLEVAWEAIENAMIPADQLAEQRVGVFVGIGGTDYSKIPSHYRNYFQQIDAHVGTGNALSIAANRLSYILNLRGPSLAVDTACSSGLIATHLAVQSLRRGETDAALAAGVNLILSPETTIAFSKARMLSPDGVCRPFDAGANGYVRGEGCGVLLLKRLDDARRDGDAVLAVIRGSAANQDGRTSGITAPNGESQKVLIREALQDAGLTLDDVSYIEAHGTGTPLGDPIEVRALADLFPRKHADEPTCYFASAKGNIGHTETVSGVAGLIKTVLMMQHGVAPPQANFQELNPHIELTDTRLAIPHEETEWKPIRGARIAGVSSFGFGGANVHLVLSDADQSAAEQTVDHAASPPTPRIAPDNPADAAPPLTLLSISARTAQALPSVCERYADALSAAPAEQWQSLCAAATRGRSHFNYRAGLVAGNREELVTALRAVAAGESAPRAVVGHADGARRPKVAFVYTGQGSQQPGMGRELYETEPVFRDALRECDALCRPHVGASLVEVIYAGDADERLDQTAFTQPALFAIQYALTRLWESWGVRPDLVLGHSVGEYAAACASGVMSLEDGAALIATRGALMQRLPAGGAMASVAADGATVQDELAAMDCSLDIAALNGPASTVVSGREQDVAAVAQRFKERGVATQLLNVSHAFHSSLMEDVLDPFAQVADRLHYQPPRAAFVSTLLGAMVDNGELDAGYWRRHIRDAVRFEEGFRRLLAEKPQVIVEIGPAPQLLGMARRFAESDGMIWTPSLRPGMTDHTVMLRSAAELYVAGAAVDPSPLSVRRPELVGVLPTYPFQHDRYWLNTDEALRGTPSFGASDASAGPVVHPLVGALTPIAGERDVYQTNLDAPQCQYLRDHRVQGSPVLPAAAYLEQALALGLQQYEATPIEVTNLAIDQAMFLEDVGPTVQVQVAQQAGALDIAVYSGRVAEPAENSTGEEQAPNAHKPAWTRHATAEIAALTKPLAVESFDVEKLKEECFDHQTRDSFYQLMDARGLSYGPQFRGLGDVWRATRHAVAEIELPDAAAEALSPGLLHPVLGDACLQAIAAVVPLEPDGGYCPSTYMPTRIDRFHLAGDPREIRHLYLRRTSPESSDPRPETVTADIWLLDASGTAVAQFQGARMLRVDRHATDATDQLAQAVYQITWTPAPPLGGPMPDAAAGRWLLIADQAGVADELAAAIDQAGGAAARLSPSGIDSLPDTIANSGAAPLRVVDLAAVDAVADSVQHDHCQRLLRLVHTLATADRPAKLTVATRGGQAAASGEDVVPSASAVWGMARVAANEHPELACRLVDLDPKQDPAQQAASLLGEVLAPEDELQVAYRQGQRLAARYTHEETLLAEPVAAELAPPSGGGAYRVELASPGSFDGLAVRQHLRPTPPAGHVEVEIGATGLNFSDVLKALGLYPGIKDEVVPIGIEAAGVVSAVGEGVDRFQVGQPVMGVVPYSFASHATTAEHALAPTPKGVTAEQAATIPIVFLTAYHGLVRLAGLARGERVLIHAGAGGVGLAAIQIAQHLGAEVYATAGSDKKRDFLRSLGVDHVYDSRSLDFADQIRQDTGHEGVDVVLNSLPGAAIRESLRLLRAYGRFLEIGKTDIYADRALGLAPFQDNLSYFAIDLDRVLRQRGAYVRELFDEVVGLFNQGVLHPLELTCFEFAKTREAFRYMAQRKNIGKVIVRAADHSAPAGHGAAAQPRATDGAWLVTGGLGALGLQVAEWLARKGAPRIGLLSRRTPSESVEAQIAAIAALGAEVIPLQGDVLDPASLDSAIQALQHNRIPLTGVVHAAGLLDDGVLFEMTPDQLDRAMAPKTHGAWNLHRATQSSPVQEFVLFSSIACVLGSPGQANYAAGNAYLDGLAHHRRAAGLPARSINWGPWAAGGMATTAGRDQGLTARGVQLLQPALAFAALDRLLATDITQVSLLLPQWEELLAGASQTPALLKDIASQLDSQDPGGGVDHQFRSQLLSASAEERDALLQDYFLDELAKIMGLSVADVDASQPLNSLGLDSLMAIELKNNVERRLGVVLPMARFMEGPSAVDLAQQVGQLLSEEGPTELAAPDAGHDQGDQPLSRGQQALWFLHQLAPQSTAYNIADAVRVRGTLDLDALKCTLADLVSRHGVFRATFHNDRGRPYQTIHAERPTPLEVIDAQGWSEEQVNQRVAQEVHTPFNLEQGPLLRVVVLRRSAEEHVLLFALHHIIADFWSLVACTEEFRQLYDHHANGRDAALPEIRLSYGDFTRWQAEMLASQQGEAHWQYWKEQLAGELPVLSLPTDRPRPPVQTYNGRLAFRWLDAKLTGQLKNLAESHGATLNMVLLAAYQLLLHRYSGQDDLVVGLPTSGRSRAEFAPVAGYFVNPVPVRSTLKQDLTFQAYLDQVRKQTLGALEHQDFPFPELVERLRVDRDPSRSALFQALFVMQRAQVMHDQGLTPFLMGKSGATLEMAGLAFESMTLEQWVAQFDVSLAASEADGGVSLGLQYNTDLFDHSTIEQLLEAYDRLLQDIATRPEVNVGALRLLSDADQQRLADWNATTAAPRDDLPVHARIAEQAAKTPDQIAVACGAEHVTYGRLDQQANRLAYVLQSAGVAAGDRVGLCLPRCVDLVVGMLAVLKAGAAYVPLDPTYPKRRVDAILDAAGMSTVVTYSQHAELVAGAGRRVMALDTLSEQLQDAPAKDPKTPIDPGALVYVIFTSGSTGDPKGAGVTHGGFGNLLDWYLEDLQLDASDCVLVVTSHGFDLTQKNFFATLAVGGRLQLSTAEVYDPEVVRTEIAENQVTLFNATPSNFYPLVDERYAQHYGKLKSLRHVVLGGEPIDLGRVAAWRNAGGRAQLINSYGPTECSDVVARHRVTDADYASGRGAPIGRPIRNTQAHIVDQRLRAMPLGATGELCLSGACVGVGYVNDARLTAEKFVTLPTGERAYRTGDLCRWNEDGQLEFVGRGDHQVKIRGFRIELGDIEQAMTRHPNVVEAVVVVDDRGDSKRLIGYAATGASQPDASIDLRAMLAEHLPPHMVPAVVMLLDKLPQTPHGKVDRCRLPTPEEAAAGGGDYAAPQGEREAMLAALWADVLHVQRIGRHDNFFDQGGDSLRSIEVVARLAAERWRTTPAQLLRSQTIAELAPHLSRLDEEQQKMHVGPAPLTPIQHWFFDQHFDAPSHYNQSILLETPPGLQFDLVQAACVALAATHESLRTRFTQRDGAWLQQVTAQSRLICRQEVYTGDDAQLEAAVAHVQASLSLTDGPLGAVVLFDGGTERHGRLLVCLHHLVTDPYSTRLLLEDLQSAYLQAAAGGEVVLPPPATPLSQWTRTLWDWDAQPAADFWQALVDGATDNLPGVAASGENTVGSLATVGFGLDENHTRRLLDHPESAPVVLLAALATAVELEPGSPPVLVDVERLGRESLADADPSRTVGWLVSMHPFQLAAGRDAAATLAETAARWSAIEHQGIGWGVVRYGPTNDEMLDCVKPQVRFNYLGAMQQARASTSDAFRPVALQGAAERATHDRRTHLWELDAAVRDGVLHVAWAYSSNAHTATWMRDAADRYRAAIIAMLEA